MKLKTWFYKYMGLQKKTFFKLIIYESFSARSFSNYISDFYGLVKENVWVQNVSFTFLAFHVVLIRIQGIHSVSICKNQFQLICVKTQKYHLKLRVCRLLLATSKWRKNSPNNSTTTFITNRDPLPPPIIF